MVNLTDNEWIDVVDDCNRIVKREIREIVHQTDALHRGVHVFVFNQKSDLLVQIRAQDRHQSPGLLDCSVSEHLKTGESYISAAVRGLSEELGLRGLTPTRLAQLRMNYGPGDNKISEVYEARLTDNPAIIAGPEVARVEFISIKDLLDLALQQPGMFSIWFHKLILWYAGRPVDLQIIWECDH